MTTYTFKPSGVTTSANWSDPSFWTGGVVPNGADADVDFPVVTRIDTGEVYTTSVTIQAGESFSVRSVGLNDPLVIGGGLTVSAGITGGGISMSGGTLVAGTLQSYVAGNGHIVVGTLRSDTQISGGDLVIDVDTLINNGLISASGGTTTVNVGAGGFSSLVDGTLLSGGVAAADGTLQIHASGPIFTDAAAITLGNRSVGTGGMIASYDPATGQYVPLTSSLHTVSETGTLTFAGGDYHFGALAVYGKLISGDLAHFSADTLTIAAGGILQGGGTLAQAVENNGVIAAGRPSDIGIGNQGVLVIDGAVTGSGTLEVLGGQYIGTRFPIGASSTLEIAGPTAQNVVFQNHLGTLILDRPADFTGSITTTGAGDVVILAGVSRAAITDISFAQGAGSGVLTLQQGSSALNVRFGGAHTLSDFSFTAGSQVLSTDPGSLIIGIGGHGAAPTQDFDGNESSDLMWLNADGTFRAWTSSGSVATPTDSFNVSSYTNGNFVNWAISDTFDFNGDGIGDVLWRNTNGQVSVWAGNGPSFPMSFTLGAFDTRVDNSFKIVGAADFNGDGKDDILWRNDDGSIATWFSTGTSFYNAYNATVGVSWKVEGAGDFNGDGRADIFWRNAHDGTVAIWSSNGPGFVATYFQGPLGLSWHAQGIGDFNGDAHEDIVWRNDNGAVTVWLGTADAFTENTFNATVPDGWNIANVGDYDGDGRDDLMWRNENGWTSAWNSTGTGWHQGATFDTGVGTDWILAGHHFVL